MVRKERLVTTSTEPLHVRPLGARHPTGTLANPARLTVNLEPTACVVDTSRKVRDGVRVVWPAVLL